LGLLIDELENQTRKGLAMGRSEVVCVDVESCFFPARACRLVIVATFLCTFVWLAMSSNSQATVVLFDNFDDADRDNNGTTDDGNNTPVAVNDGIKWFRANPLSDPSFNPQPNPKFAIKNDAIDPVNNPDGIGSGNALAVQSIHPYYGDWAGFFPSTITLGPDIGDKLVVSFDMRVTSALFPPSASTGLDFATLRFGLWQDTDDQLGMASVDGLVGNPLPSRPTVWGQTDGYFENCAFHTGVGACGDYGVWGRIQSGTEPTATYPLEIDHFSIGEELNANISTGGNADNELIAVADGLNGNALFSDMPVVLQAPRTISLSLERVAPNESGQGIRIEVAVDGMAFGAQPAAGTIAAQDSFDYFMLVHNNNISEYLIDNFKVELIDGPATLPGDYNGDNKVDAADYVTWRKNPGNFGNDLGYTTWRANFGMPPGIGSGSTAVPEPASLQPAILLLLGAFVAFRRYQ
jgi:hypothetical protein